MRLSGFRLATMLGLVMLAWPLSARAEWREASSAHFVVYAQDSESDVRGLSEQLERYHSALELATGTQLPAPSPSNRVTVYVAGSKADVRAAHGAAKGNVVGFYLPRAGGSMAVVPDVHAGAGPASYALKVLLHEYTHHFMISGQGHASPKWLSEGSAEFFASASFGADGSISVGLPATHRAAGLKSGRAASLTVAELLDPAANDSSTDAFYGKSWLLYHYLTFDPARKGQLQQYVALTEGGMPSRDAGLQAFGDLAVLERELAAYRTGGDMPSLIFRPDPAATRAMAVRSLSAGEEATMSLRMRQQRGLKGEAAAALAAEARVVAARYPADPAVQAVLAAAEHDAGNDVAAVAAADAALARDPARADALVAKGLSLFRMAGRAPVATRDAAYLRALAPFTALGRIERDHPLPLLYSYRITTDRGIRPGAQVLGDLARASALAPFDLQLRTRLGMEMLREGRQDAARAALQPVAFDPHGGALADYARAALARAESGPKWDTQPAVRLSAIDAGRAEDLGGRY